MNSVDILILGAGWTSDFLIPLLQENNISFAATTRDGRERSGVPTKKFVFDHTSDDTTPFKQLPDAQTVVIIFPIYVSGASAKLVDLWKRAHSGTKAAFIQLGSTGIWDGGPTVDKANWINRKSPYSSTNDRARAEEELLSLFPETNTTVLNLPGLWGGERNPQRFIIRVITSKEILSQKDNVHFIHGSDVARAILAVHMNYSAAAGQRWLLSDGRYYDWWDLASAWGSSDHGTWVRELMSENSVHALPREPSAFKRVLDSRDFWVTFGLSPKRSFLMQ